MIKDLKPITVIELLEEDSLQIPHYQRPYKWTEKNVNQLIDDIILYKEKSAYRLGTLVIHKHNKDDKDILDIVDGQQRIITLNLIAHAINKLNKKEKTKYHFNLLARKFKNDISKYNIQNNYKIIEQRVFDFDEESIDFLFSKCEFVQVILDDISEAFQFFDSQNARGKDLEPHDLLKAFHLREMAHLSEEENLKSVSTWESMETEELSNLFSKYLYRIRNWSIGISARYFTKDEVNVFKGISPEKTESFPFEQLFRIAHFYTESYNNASHRYIDKNTLEYPFQIDQTIINGKRFFEMIAHYKKVIDDIRSNELNKLKKECILPDDESHRFSKKILDTISNYAGMYRTGDKYVNDLFNCGVIYFLDKFGEKFITKAIEKIFIWAYTLRLIKYAVHIASIDTHAIGKGSEKDLGNIDLFVRIHKATHPSEIINTKLDVESERLIKSDKTSDILKLFEDMRYYDGKL